LTIDQAARSEGLGRGKGFAVKRAIDVIGASAMLLVCAPIMMAIAIAIKLNSRGPVLFRQVREGFQGTPFMIVKFRSMVVGADQGKPITATTDPRITPVGRFIRRTSLDELPQVFNVLRGEMSLVGPRAQLVGTTRPEEIRRLDVRPGLTGLVEVQDPHLLSWDQRMRLDIWYVDNRSLSLDLTIILRTIPIMLSRKNSLDPPRS
jgi:lipopolysaccharide/colanic/teichoic acid biosynthesis glycosyltransferase